MNRALVVLFLVIITLPLATNLVGIDGADSTTENRELNPFPARPDSWSAAAEYPGAFGRWFDDHFGFRQLLVRGHAQGHLFVFGVSPSNAVIKGQEGWLFYAQDGALEDYTNEKPLTSVEVGMWRDAIVGARDWLRGQHIGYVLTVAPDKHVIYPEHIPPSIRPMGTLSRMDQVYATLEGTGVSAIDLRPSLHAGKTDERLYFMTDTHWNDRGAFIAYQKIIDAARRQVPAVPASWKRDEFRATAADVQGRDLAGMLGLTTVLHEVDLRLEPKRQRRARVIEPPGADPTAQVGRLVTEINDPRLPRAVIFRDSFSSRLVPFLSEHFSRAVYVWQNDFDTKVILEERPNVVIQEIVSRHLYTFLASPELVPR
jgi:alginate O-acetyltransferase complex protein AlgJ